MKYAFFIDIDGTLMFEGRLPKENIDAIAKARKNGHYVFINTGRSLAAIQPVVKESIQFDGFVTALGSYITVGNKVIHECPVSDEILKETYGVLSRYKPFFGGNDFTAAAPGRNYDVKVTCIANSVEDVLGKVIHKISMLGTVSPKDARIIEKYFELYQHETYFEICLKGNSKAVGIKKVRDYLGIDGIKTVAIGDSLNDVPMFEAADYSAVMGDGVESVKEMADYVSLDAPSGGVGDAIEYFISREADI